MPDQERAERSSAKFAAIVGISLMVMYGGVATLWAVSATNAEEPAVVASVH